MTEKNDLEFGPREKFFQDLRWCAEARSPYTDRLLAIKQLNVTLDGSALRVEATDGHRIHRILIQDPPSLLVPGNYLVKKNTAKRLVLMRSNLDFKYPDTGVIWNYQVPAEPTLKALKFGNVADWSSSVREIARLPWTSDTINWRFFDFFEGIWDLWFSGDAIPLFLKNGDKSAAIMPLKF